MEKAVCEQWHIPITLPELMEKEVHVWLAPLNVPTMLSHYQQVLTEEELAQARRFYFEHDRLHWTIARAVLRLLLSHYTGVMPLRIELDKNAYGKPFIAQNVSALRFNLSHSGDFALYAFAWQREVGIDIEYMRDSVAYDELAAHVFSASEQETLRALSPALKHRAFYNAWTRKEAYIKARGLGLSLPLDLFDVSLLPNEPAVLLASREDEREVSRWSMYTLPTPSDYAGALVAEGHDWLLCCWQWRHS
jgi:4'-phosphopantetheinyl transferase